LAILQSFKRGSFVVTHEAGITDDVGREYRWQPPFHATSNGRDVAPCPIMLQQVNADDERADQKAARE